MQINAIKAFRQRLVRAGYSNVSIYYSETFGIVDVYYTSPEGVKGLSRIRISELYLYPLKTVEVSYFLP